MQQKLRTSAKNKTILVPHKQKRDWWCSIFVSCFPSLHYFYGSENSHISDSTFHYSTLKVLYFPNRWFQLIYPFRTLSSKWINGLKSAVDWILFSEIYFTSWTSNFKLQQNLYPRYPGWGYDRENINTKVSSNIHRIIRMEWKKK